MIAVLMTKLLTKCFPVDLLYLSSFSSIWWSQDDFIAHSLSLHPNNRFIFRHRLTEYPRSELKHTHPTVNSAFFFLFVTGHLTKKICTYFANVQISMNNPCTFATLNPKTHRCIHTLFESQSKN